MFLQGILSLISLKHAQQKDFHTGPICTTMSSFFLACKTKPLSDKLEKAKELLSAVFWQKKYQKYKKSKDTFLWDFFFVMNQKTDVKNVIKN